jgi:hypothetical protein
MKIVTDYQLERFTSRNGMKMGKGIDFNWEILSEDQNSKIFLVAVENDNLFEYTYFKYFLEEKILEIGGIPFKVKDLVEAEQFIKKHLKAVKHQVAPLYQKED